MLDRHSRGGPASLRELPDWSHLMQDDPRLTRPEDRYEGVFTKALGKFASISIFLVFFALVGFAIAKLMPYR